MLQGLELDMQPNQCRYLQELESLFLCESVTFINAAKNFVEIRIVYQHIIYFASCYGSFYAATYCINTILRSNTNSWFFRCAQAMWLLSKSIPDG